MRKRAVKKLYDHELLRELFASKIMRDAVLDRLWELLFLTANETLLSFLIEHSSRQKLIWNLFKITEDKSRHEWLYYCTRATIDTMVRRGRDPISYEGGERLIKVLRVLHDNDPELRPYIKRFEGSELVQEDYLWVEFHNPDDSYGFSTPALYFRLKDD